jgi:methyl-accepting chemotaxis protein
MALEWEMKKRASGSFGSGIYKQIVEDVLVCAMLCDLKDFTVTYADKASLDALKGIQHALKIPADEIVGSSIDVFHKNPAHQRAMLAGPKHLPQLAEVSRGGKWLDLLATTLFLPLGRELTTHWDHPSPATPELC